MFKTFLVCCYSAVCSWLVGHSNIFWMVSMMLPCNSWVLRLVSRVLLSDYKTWLANSRVLWVVSRVFLCFKYFRVMLGDSRVFWVVSR